MHPQVHGNSARLPSSSQLWDGSESAAPGKLLLKSPLLSNKFSLFYNLSLRFHALSSHCALKIFSWQSAAPCEAAEQSLNEPYTSDGYVSTLTYNFISKSSQAQKSWQGNLQAMKRAELRDELYMQLIKQSRGNTSPTAFRAWELFLMLASTTPPSKEFVGLVSEYVHTVSHNEEELDKRVKKLALRTWHALKRSAKAGARRTVRTPYLFENTFKPQITQMPDLWQIVYLGVWQIVHLGIRLDSRFLLLTTLLALLYGWIKGLKIFDRPLSGSDFQPRLH